MMAGQEWAAQWQIRTDGREQAAVQVRVDRERRPARALGVDRKDERCELPAGTDELGPRVGPRLALLRLQRAHEPAAAMQGLGVEGLEPRDKTAY